MSYRIFTLILFFTLTGSIKLSSQVCNDFSCKMKLARAAFKKEQYKQALDQALGALYYDAGKKNEVDKFINEVYQAIEDKRIEAEKQRNAARVAGEKLGLEKKKLETALHLADSMKKSADYAREQAIIARDSAKISFEIARQKELEAQRDRQKADSSLALYQRRSGEIVDLYMKEVNRLILEMKYDQAADTLLVAAGFGNATRSFRRGLTELAFWFNEAGENDRAVDLFLHSNQGDLPINTDSIRQFIARYEPEWNKVLMSRYYGEMIFVKGGVFTYGIRKQSSAQDFWMAKTETTFWQYGLFCSSKGRSLLPFKEPGWEIKGNEPLINVTWFEATEYANWLSVRFGLKPAYMIDLQKRAAEPVSGMNGFRLPSEIEWEYAAKGGIYHQYFNYAGSGTNNADSVGWGPGNCVRTQAVGLKRANALGFYDLTGNVWEWCSYLEKSSGVLVRTGKNKQYIVRGGSWDEKVNISQRQFVSRYPKVKNAFGFRLSKDYSLDVGSLTQLSVDVQRRKLNNIISDTIFINANSPIEDNPSMNLILRDINKQILNMDYSLAVSKINALSSEEKQNSMLRRPIFEIAFWWNEIGKPQIASDFLKNCNVGVIPVQPDSIRSFLEKLDPDWYKVLLKRYYGSQVTIDGGSFTFHYKTITRVSSFNMAQTETTLWQYGLFSESKNIPIGLKVDPTKELRGNAPVVNVTWFEAIEYANWLSGRVGLQPVYRIIKGPNLVASKNLVQTSQDANGYRLPTETEWEYAAKGGQNYNYSKYAGGDDFNEVAWGPQNCEGPQPVARKSPNALGIYDLSGNAAEWCWDRYNGTKSYPTKFLQDYKGPQTGSKRMIRGGSWKNQAGLIQRFYPGSTLSPYHSNNKTGFRLVSGF